MFMFNKDTTLTYKDTVGWLSVCDTHSGDLCQNKGSDFIMVVNKIKGNRELIIVIWLFGKTELERKV